MENAFIFFYLCFGMILDTYTSSSEPITINVINTIFWRDFHFCHYKFFALKNVSNVFFSFKSFGTHFFWMTSSLPKFGDNFLEFWKCCQRHGGKMTDTNSVPYKLQELLVLFWRLKVIFVRPKLPLKVFPDVDFFQRPIEITS